MALSVSACYLNDQIRSNPQFPGQRNVFLVKEIAIYGLPEGITLNRVGSGVDGIHGVEIDMFRISKGG